MNILNKIKKNWDFSKTTEQNCIHFSNEQEQKRKNIEKRNKWLVPLFCIAVIGISIFTGNPLLALAAIILSISFGSEYIFNDADSQPQSINKIDETHILITYEDIGNSHYGTNIIGTIDGDTISFGNEYVFFSNRVGFVITTMIDSTHFVTIYRNSLSAPYPVYCVIGTIAGDYSITYGSAYFIGNDLAPYDQIKMIDSTHFIICYQDNNLYSYLRIGTIAGDYSITYGSAYQIYSNRADSPHFELLDSTHIVACYVDVYGSYKRYSIIGTIDNDDEITFQTRYETVIGPLKKIDSTHYLIVQQDKVYVGTVTNGTEISHGSAYDYSTRYIAENNMSISMLDDTHFVISYSHGSSPYEGVAVIGTIAEDYSITFDEELVFNNARTAFQHVTTLNNTTFAIAYKDLGNSNKGTAIIGTYTPPITFIPRTMWF